MLSDVRWNCIKDVCLKCQMKSATTHFIFVLCQSQTGKYGTTKGQQGETLGNVVKKIMKKRSSIGRYYTYHSLRRSGATRLYDGGVPEQLIHETTGHRSFDSVRAYKYTSSAL